MKTKKFRTNYAVAVNWLHNNMILCNELPEIDESLIENAEFMEEDEDGNVTEIYQWFITDCTRSDVEYLKEHFGLLFTYSNMLYKWILCVDHWGTSWEYVGCDTDVENAKAGLGERK